MINCEKASELTSKEIDRKLTFWEMISLKFHRLICPPCGKFEDEANALTNAIDQEHREHKCSKTMSKDAKSKLNNLINSENN